MLRTLRADVIAGVSVAVVAIPQSLAYAKLAGLPAYIGLYAGILPTIVAGIAGSSPYIATGATAIVSLLTFSAIASLRDTGLSAFMVYAPLLAFMVGSIQICFSAFKAGYLIKYVAHPVIVGFIHAAAIIIGITQLDTLFGIYVDHSLSLINIANMIFQQGRSIDPVTVSFGVWSMVMLFAVHRLFPRLPGIVFVVALAALVSRSMGFSGAVVGAMPSGLPDFGLPLFDFASLQVLFLPAFIIAIIGYMEGFLVAKEIDGSHKNINANQELRALGAANIASGVSGAFPVAGSVSRTVLQYASGAKTGFGSVVVGLTTLGVVVFFPSIFTYVPHATLSAIIIFTVVKLIRPKTLYHELNGSVSGRIVVIITFVATLIVSPHFEYGIGIGMIASLVIRGINHVSWTNRH